ncbi:hypothetical protein VP01_1782g2, partial [Puccinia sorghi]
QSTFSILTITITMLAFQFSYQGNGDLKQKEEAGSQEDNFHPMYHTMITKIEEYQEESLECEVLVMATLLHPASHLIISTHCQPQREQHACRELDVFIKNMDHLATPAANNQNSLLIWWKDHSRTFPVLFYLAKDYLASSSSDLKPHKIGRCVSSHMWLKQGIQVTENFEKAQ